MEFQFLVKIEGYKEKNLTSYGNDIEDAKQKLICELNKQGFLNILYIVNSG